MNMGMNNGERAIGTPDEQYDLVSVLYHALQGAEESLQYIEDAREAKDDELANFFAEVQQEDRDRGDRAKRLLVSRIRATVP